METAHVRAEVSAGAVLTDEAGRFLIVNPTYKPHWNLPGGRVDQGETPRVACGREVKEELGLDVEVGDLLVHAYISVSGREPHTYYLFDCGSLTDAQQAAISLQESELGEYRFSTPEDIDQNEIPPLARQMWEAALIARAERRLLYVEVTG